MSAPAPGEEVDPFDLPESLGTGGVVWSADDDLAGHRVRGRLVPGAGLETVVCDLLAVDEAYPAPVADDATRLRTHQAWRHGQVHLASYDGRLTVLVPGRCFGAELVLEAIARFAKALGASPSDYAVHLRLG